MKKIALSLFFLGATSVAFADGINRNQGGAYVGVFGAADYTYDSHRDDGSASKFSRFGNGFLGSAGYQFNEFVAAETDFAYYHPTTSSASGDVSKIYQPALVLKGIVPFERLSLYGKIGAAQNMYHYVDDKTHNAIKPLVGLGVAYSLSQMFEVSLLAQTTVGRYTDHVNNKKGWDGLSFIGAGVNLYF